VNSLPSLEYLTSTTKKIPSDISRKLNTSKLKFYVDFSFYYEVRILVKQ